jgi:hypothetical protein
MNNLKRCFTVLIFLMLVFAVPVWVHGVTLDRSGTCTPDKGAYVCNDGAFQFIKAGWATTKPVFVIEMKNQCSLVRRDSYMPGWGGGGVKFETVSIIGRYNYDTHFTQEKIIHQGAEIIVVSMTCANNPWAYGYSAAGCSAPTIQNTVQYCGGPVPLDGPFPLSVRYLSSDLLAALQNWDKNRDATDPLAGWDPYGTPPGYSGLKITAPASGASIGEHAASFTLTLQNLPSGGLAKKVLMRWQRAQEVPEWQGDIHVPPGTYDWFTFTGPPSEAWSNQFPLTVAVEPGPFAGKPGHYRLQVKLASETWWSDWRSFWIGQPTFDVKKLSKTPALVAMKKNSLSAKMSITPVKGQVTKGGQVASSAKMTKQVTLKQAVVVVDSLSYRPAPTKPGNQVDLMITFKNKGQAASSADLKYSVSCIVKNGGPACAVAATTRAINKSIPAGQAYGFTLAGATPAVVGTYEVTVKPVGGAADSGRTVTINVAPTLKPTKGTLTPVKKR